MQFSSSGSNGFLVVAATEPCLGGKRQAIHGRNLLAQPARAAAHGEFAESRDALNCYTGGQAHGNARVS